MLRFADVEALGAPLTGAPEDDFDEDYAETTPGSASLAQDNEATLTRLEAMT